MQEKLHNKIQKKQVIKIGEMNKKCYNCLMIMGNIRLGQILIAGSIGFLIFFGILLTEKSRFEQVQHIRNPFKNSQILKDEIANQSEDEEVLNFLEKSGEIWHIFPGAKVDFTADNQELMKGTVVYSSHFISDKNNKLAHDSFVSNTDISSQKPIIGQIKVNNLIINAPNSIVLIKRDNIRGEIEIYAHDHAVGLFFSFSKTPYILPPRHKILLSEKHLNQVGKLFYTKQNKEFNLTLVAPTINNSENKDLEIPPEIVNTEAFRNKIYENIILFSKNEPLTWVRFQPSSVMGFLVDGIRYLQRYYGMGVSPINKENYEYFTLRKELINSFFYFEARNYFKAENAAIEFEKVLHGSDWTRFMIEHPKFLPQWEVFERSHKIYINRLYTEEKGKLFEKIWFPKKDLNSFNVFKERFFMIEHLISKKEGTRAKEEMDEIGDAFLKIKDITAKNKTQLTKIRRLMDSLLREGSFFHTFNVFDFYGKLIQLEVSLYDEKNGEQQEISLESARNILFYLQMFIDKKSDSDIAQNLVHVYSFLDIDNINQRLGRSVFSESEKETIKMVQFINGQDLTKDDIAKIQEEQSVRAWIVQQLLEVREQTEEPVEVIDNSLKTKEALIEFLEEQRIKTDGIQIQIRNKNGQDLISFAEVHYLRFPLRGTFDIKSQSFTFLQLKNTQQNKKISLNLFSSILTRLYKDAQSNATPIERPDNSNESNLEFLQKTFVARALKSENTNVDRSDIKSLDKKFTKFRINSALFNHRYKLKFDFIKGRKNSIKIQNIEVEAGANKFHISEKLDLKGFSKSLGKIIDEKLGQMKK